MELWRTSRRGTFLSTLERKVADLEGLEPPTPWFEAKCSIQLSYKSGSLLLMRNVKRFSGKQIVRRFGGGSVS